MGASALLEYYRRQLLNAVPVCLTFSEATTEGQQRSFCSRLNFWCRLAGTAIQLEYRKTGANTILAIPHDDSSAQDGSSGPDDHRLWPANGCV